MITSYEQKMMGGKKNFFQGKEDLINGKHPLEQILLMFDCTGCALNITKPPVANCNSLIICIVDNNNKDLAMQTIEIDQLEKIYGKNRPLSENVYNYADQAGHTPDIAWFEKRNKRLGIKWSDEFESYIIPPRAIGEVILSYAMSSAGMASITRDMVEDRNYNFRYCYKVKLIYFGKTLSLEAQGWHEELLLFVDKLEKYTKK